MSIVSFAQTVDIDGGRGRATREAVASIRRIDAQLGRPLDINSAWRDPEVQQKLRDAYLHYRLYGAPWAPIALAPKDSIHCRGTAIDTDDGYNPAVVRILNDHGWFHTVYRWENGRRVLKEPWHFEYFPDRDNHRNDPAPAGESAPIPIPILNRKEPDMATGVIYTDDKTDKARSGAIVNTESGLFSPFGWFSKSYADNLAKGFGLPQAGQVTRGQYDQVRKDMAELRALRKS